MYATLKWLENVYKTQQWKFKIISTLNFQNRIYVQRKVRIGTILALYLRIVRIPTLSADSGIVPDNSRIAQGVFYRFLL